MEIPHIMELLVSEYTRKEKKMYFILYCVTYLFVWISFFFIGGRGGGGGKNSKDFGRHILILL